MLTAPDSSQTPPEPSNHPVHRGSGDCLLTSEQMAHLEEFGYLALDRITSPEDAARLGKVIKSLFANKAGFERGAQFNLVGTEEGKDTENIFQLLKPHQYAKELIESEYYANAFAMARQILGPEARYAYDHALLKPPNGPSTPWHQDEASHDPRFNYREVHIWMPFQPVDKVNGCMEFIPGTNRSEVLPHRSVNNDPRIHAIECHEGFDPADAVACPLPAGGCTIHLARTLHTTGPNRSTAPRLSYVLVFEVPHIPAAKPREFPWQKEKKTARMKREREWELRDGYPAYLARKVQKKLGNAYRRFFK